MGKMIDADGAKEILYVSEDRIANNLRNQITSYIRENYIPKADYENRLKADMVAMLTELQLELEELPEARFYKKNEYGDVIGYIEYPAISKDALLLIQQKIDKLKENKKWK